ncbi:MAG: DUF368 domain-containing protein [Burkholderiaceae bacterium]
MNRSIALFLKGMAMGAANVIPGVSGGTIALVTGIYERLIHALKSCNLSAARLLLKGRFGEFWNHIDGGFLLVLLAGVGISIVSLARLFKYLLAYHEIPTMAFFFGLILLSVWYVGRTVRQWNFISVAALLAGTAIAVGIALLAPASENNAPIYLFVCGVAAICSMILPGLSGSFVLIIMGNYALVLGAVSSFDFGILIPMALGCVVGLIGFAQVLSWILRRYHDQTIALMTGFVLGSLAVIWPWKDKSVVMIERVGKPVKEVVTGYDWYVPVLADAHTLLALSMMLVGALTIWLTEKLGRNK